MSKEVAIASSAIISEVKRKVHCKLLFPAIEMQRDHGSRIQLYKVNCNWLRALFMLLVQSYPTWRTTAFAAGVVLQLKAISTFLQPVNLALAIITNAVYLGFIMYYE